MPYSIEDLTLRINNPRETLDTELKSWIDPQTPEAKAKIAKACIALRNNNGGLLIIGIRDDEQPDVGNEPQDIRHLFRQDAMQAIVSTYASKPFEVEVQFVNREGIEYPIICVPSGVEVPVAAKSDLFDANNNPLVRTDAVYVRSLLANNRVSSTAARHKDWERIAKVCFDNREADIGAFMRRHLPQFQQIRVDVPDAMELAKQYLDECHNRFEARIADRPNPLPDCGFREAAFLIDGEVPPRLPDRDFFDSLQVQMPNHSGWPPFFDSRAGENEMRPVVIDNGWQALIDLLEDGPWSHFDFWRMEPAGRFYAIRALEDDLRNPGFRRIAALDPALQISRVAELISVGLSFARTIGCDPGTCNLNFVFRWSKLRGRTLFSWSTPEWQFFSAGASEQDSITSDVIVPLTTAQAAIPSFVETVVAPLFVVFAGSRVGTAAIERIANETINRRL